MKRLLKWSTGWWGRDGRCWPSVRVVKRKTRWRPVGRALIADRAATDRGAGAANLFRYGLQRLPRSGRGRPLFRAGRSSMIDPKSPPPPAGRSTPTIACDPAACVRAAAALLPVGDFTRYRIRQARRRAHADPARGKRSGHGDQAAGRVMGCRTLHLVPPRTLTTRRARASRRRQADRGGAYSPNVHRLPVPTSRAAVPGTRVFPTRTT